MIDNLLIAVNAFAMCLLISLSVDEILQQMYGNLSTNFKGLQLEAEIAHSCLRHMNTVLFTFN